MRESKRPGSGSDLRASFVSPRGDDVIAIQACPIAEFRIATSQARTRWFSVEPIIALAESFTSADRSRLRHRNTSSGKTPNSSTEAVTWFFALRFDRAVTSSLTPRYSPQYCFFFHRAVSGSTYIPRTPVAFPQSARLGSTAKDGLDVGSTVQIRQAAWHRMRIWTHGRRPRSRAQCSLHKRRQECRTNWQIARHR